MSNDTPNPPRVPANNEHMEALQAETNARRAEVVAQLTPEEQAKMAVIESVAQQLEQAKIPFALWGCPLDKKYRFWRFQKLDYLPEETSFKERAAEAMRVGFWCLNPTITTWMAAGAVKYIAFYDKDARVMFAHDLRGEDTAVIVPSEEEKE